MNQLILTVLAVLVVFFSSGQISDPIVNDSNKHLDRLYHLLDRANFYDQQKYHELSVAFVDSIIGHMYDNQLPYYDDLFVQKTDSIINKSIVLMSAIIQQQPLPYNYAVRAALYGLQGSFNQGIIDLNSAIIFDSSNSMFYYNRALFFKKVHNLDAALKDYNNCIKLDKSYGAAYHNRGFLYMEMKNYEGALSDFLTALSLCNNLKDSSYAYNNIGYLHFLNKKQDLALEYINKSINLNEMNPYAYKNKALVEIELNKFHLACQNLQKAIDLGIQDQYGDEVYELIKKYCRKE